LLSAVRICLRVLAGICPGLWYFSALSVFCSEV